MRGTDLNNSWAAKSGVLFPWRSANLRGVHPACFLNSPQFHDCSKLAPAVLIPRSQSAGREGAIRENSLSGAWGVWPTFCADAAWVPLLLTPAGAVAVGQLSVVRARQGDGMHVGAGVGVGQRELVVGGVVVAAMPF